MSLLCSESESVIPGRRKAYAVSHPLGPGYAVDERAIVRIPVSERRPLRCDQFEEGLNVHEGEGAKGELTGNWQTTTFAQGKFLFSISEETAKRYLPRTVALIAKDIAEEAN